jgi:hypothetical protein
MVQSTVNNVDFNQDAALPTIASSMIGRLAASISPSHGNHR